MTRSSPASDRHVVLVGMMGAGKTTIGRRLARTLGRPFIDSDQQIEARARRTVREIFESDGEAAFRALETEVLADALATEAPSVIAAAGGTVLSEVNRARMREAGRVVWLRASPTALADRVVHGTHRPLLADDPTGTLERLDSQRRDLYESVADHVVDTTARAPDDILDELLKLVTTGFGDVSTPHVASRHHQSGGEGA